MKKLRFVSLMVAALFMGFGFTSCEDDDSTLEGESTIVVTVTEGPDDSYEVGDSIVVKYQVILTDNKLEQIEIRKGTQTLNDFTVTDFDNNTSYLGSFGYKTTQEEDIEFAIIVEDNKGNTETKVVLTTVVEPVPETTPLGTAESVVLTYKSSSQTDGENISELLGLEYASNVDGNTAEFEVLASKGNSFVMIIETEATAIETVEELAGVYNAGDQVNSFMADADALFEDIWFVTMVDEVYYWVHMTGLTFEAGNNQAYFDYKK